MRELPVNPLTSTEGPHREVPINTSQLRRDHQEILGEKRGRSPASINNYNVLKTIGKGHYSKVKLAQDKRTGEFFAIKIVKRHHVESVSLPTFRRILANEVQLLQSLDHTNIIKLIEYNHEGENIVKKSGKCIQIYFIVLELVEQGDLFSYIKVKTITGGFQERFARYYFNQLIDTVEYLHQNAQICHRDLKPENILLNAKYQLKIADFGLSTHREGSQRIGISYSQVGTRQYQAPEVLEKRSYKAEYVDIFSMGVILFVMVSGSLPYLKEASYKDPLYKLIVKKQPGKYWSAWRQFRNPKKKAKTPIDMHVDLNEQSNFFKDFLGALLDIVVSLLGVIYQGLVLIWSTILSLCRERPQHPVETRYTFSPEFMDLVTKMISYNFKERPSLQKIREHPWMKNREVPGQKEIEREMSGLHQRFLIQEIMNFEELAKEPDMRRDVRLPKSRWEYCKWMFQLNKTALIKGLLQLNVVMAKNWFVTKILRWQQPQEQVVQQRKNKPKLTPVELTPPTASDLSVEESKSPSRLPLNRQPIGKYSVKQKVQLASSTEILFK